MDAPPTSIAQLLQQDRRYKIEAYAFVFNALRYGHEVMGMGAASPPGKEKKRPLRRPAGETPPPAGETEERHLSGQELCEAIRQYAFEQFGYMAQVVLNSWGVKNTGDFGEIVFNLIRAGEMRKTDDDRREDFDNVYDFDSGLRQGFEIKMPTEPA